LNSKNAIVGELLPSDDPHKYAIKVKLGLISKVLSFSVDAGELTVTDRAPAQPTDRQPPRRPPNQISR
jgi:hypothetical protein